MTQLYKILMVYIFSIKFLCNGEKINLDYICYSPQILSENDRDVSQKCTQSQCNKCDTGVSYGWYAFGENARLPDFCPSFYSCMTQATYWTNDIQPNTTNQGPFEIELCLSMSMYGNDTTDCRSSCSKIRTAFCSNLNMIIYELTPVPLCNIRYCQQKSIPCDKNESSSTGFKPCQANFPFDKLTNGTTGVSSALTEELFLNVSGTLAKCTLNCPNGVDCSVVNGDVLWFSGKSVASFQKTSLFYDPVNNTLYSFLKESEWLPAINTYIRCNIIPRVDSLQPYFHIYTEPYFFGMFLKVSQHNTTYAFQNHYENKEILVELGEITENSAILEVYSTLPILCKTSTSCSLKIVMTKESIYKEIDFIRATNCKPDCGGCSKEIKNQIKANPNNKAVWNIITTVEPNNVNDISTIKLQLFVKGSLDIFGDFWKDLLLPTINIRYIPKNVPLKYAYSYNDPHMKTFDGTTYEFHEHGDEYLMMENENTMLRVHAIAVHCSKYYYSGFLPHAYCNDKIYIQSIDDVIIHDRALGDDVLYYVDLASKKNPIPVRIPFENDYAKFYKQTAMQINKLNGQFKIVTHFATTIFIRFDGSFEIYPSKMDKYQVWGLLGNYDNDLKNDLTETKGKSVSSLEEFIETYRIKSPRPLMSLGNYYFMKNGVWDAVENLTKYCICTNNTGTINFVCPLGLVQVNTRVFIGSPKRQIYDDDSFRQIYLNVLERLTYKFNNFQAEKLYRKTQQEVKLHRAKRATMDSCEQKLNISVFRICDSQGLINLQTMIDSCKLDYNMSGIDIWSDGYYESTSANCKHLLDGDKNNFINDNGVMKKQENILSQLCLNNCSNHGTCVSGICNCTYPYTYDDCSINRETVPVIINSTMVNNVCDTKTDSCADLILLINQVSSEMNLILKTYFKTNDSTLVQIDTAVTLNVLTFSRNTVYANLLEPSQKASGHLSVVFYSITVKDLKSSEPVLYAIYNSDCQSCNSPNDCYVKTETCDIDNNCYKTGDTNPINQNEICNFTVNKYAWSKKTLSAVTATTQPGISPGIIVAIVVPIAFVLLAVLVGGIVAFVVMKKKRNNEIIN